MVVQENANSAPPPPAVMWAQRWEVVFLTFCLEDCRDADINITAEKVHFKGTGGTENKFHELTIDLYQPVDPEKSTKTVRERNIEVVLRKEKAGTWPHLTKEKKKYHWLKVDFNRWEEDDSSDDEAGRNMPNFDEVMGGIGGGDSIPFNEDEGLDSDDEDLPDLE